MDWATDHHVFIYSGPSLMGTEPHWMHECCGSHFLFFFFLDPTTFLPIPFPAMMFDDSVLWALVA